MKLSLSLLAGALAATQAAADKQATPDRRSPAANCRFWMEDVPHRGVAAFNPQENFLVWRNVKDFGAKGDGVTDDTDAIQAAISSNETYASSSHTISTNTPNTVYFPPGTYMVQSSLQLHFATQMVGNPNCMPVIKASATFPTSTSFSYVLDANYQEKWSDTILFYRQVRNLIVDTTAAAPDANISAIHWPASQATTLQNLEINMPVNSNHVGLIMPGGSGGYLGDLVFNGGRLGMSLGNEQFTVRNVTFNRVTEAIHQSWNWGLTYLGIQIKDCNVGIRVSDATQVRSVILVDSQVSNTPLALVTAYTPGGKVTAAAVVLENVGFSNVTTIVQDGTGAALLAGAPNGGTTTVAGWAIGHSYTGASAVNLTETAIAPNKRPASLTAAGQKSHGLVPGAYFSMSKPLYADEPASAFLSVRAAGGKGDGVTDDTAAVQHAIDTALARRQIVYFDAGVYRVSRTVTIPPGSRVVGENFATIMSSGSFFVDYDNPKAVVQVGQSGGPSGTVYWQDMLVQVQGQQSGAKLIEWNLASPADRPSGMWDVHGRTGGTLGTNLRAAECPKITATQVNETSFQPECRAAYAQMHITKAASGVYLENVWFWGSDVDLDADYTRSPQNLIYTARGLLVESKNGPVWLLAAAFEHCVLYNYQFAEASTIFASQLHSDIYIYGAGHYSLHTDWMNGCGNSGRCQARIVSLESSDVHYYDLHIVGADIMVTVDGQDIIPRAPNVMIDMGEVAVFRSR